MRGSRACHAIGLYYVLFIYILGKLNEELLHFERFGFTSGIFFVRKNALSSDMQQA